MKYLIIILLWTGYCAIHSYLISIKFTNLMKSFLNNYYAFYRFFYVLVSFILLLPLINYTTQTDSNVIITYLFPISIVRHILIYSSLLIFIWAFFFNYDSLSFFGIRQILELKSQKKIATSGELKRNGLLGIMRHPMYFALLIYLWCQTYRLMDIVVNIILTIYIIIGTKLEENKLILEFGDKYKNYQKEVPMLIPFFHIKKILI